MNIIIKCKLFQQIQPVQKLAYAKIFCMKIYETKKENYGIMIVGANIEGPYTCTCTVPVHVSAPCRNYP